MSKFLAILKDSFYETIDFKIFYVLIGISLFLAIACASFVFIRHPVGQVLEKNFEGGFEVRDIDKRRESFFSPYGRYRFILEPNRRTDAPMQMYFLIESRRWIMERLKDDEFEETGPRMRAEDRDRYTNWKRPDSPESWKRFTIEYLNSKPGFGETAILSDFNSSTDLPDRIEVECTVNWGEIPHSHQIGYVFGIWRQDMEGVPLAGVVWGIQYAVTDWIAGWIGIIVAIVVTAGFVPNMLRKGTVDFLITKPISRSGLLVYKYLGGLTFVFFNSVILIGGTWIAFGLTTANWSPYFLLSIFVLTFAFAILYALSVLIGVLTRSSLAAILITIGAWFVFSLVSSFQIMLSNAPAGRIPDWVLTAVKVVHWVLPKPSDLSQLNQLLLAHSTGMTEIIAIQEHRLRKAGFSWGQTIGTSVGFMAIMLSLACWRFTRRDY